ncbi:MAG TPA: SRPBCC family protein [Streptosporangiaceae bacterium]|nr:SRPBCC family protein [Streptosporangiaceae bacterium]
MATTKTPSHREDATPERPTDLLKGEVNNLLGAVRDRTLDSLEERVGGVTERLTEYAKSAGGPGLMAAVTGGKKLAEGKSPTRAVLSATTTGLKEKVAGMFGKGGGKGGQGKNLKVTNIVETLEVGVPIRVAYNQWTQFRDFPSFMKKVENVDQESDEKLNWKAQIWWSHRNWESTILQQHPDERIIWRSKGAKGYVDGAVTFEELGPNLTRILMVLEYNPKGLFEHTGNLWRAQGRRARLEFKHFRRHVMTQAILHPDDVEGWRGVIEDGEVVKDHETAVREEQEQQEQGGAAEDEYEDQQAPTAGEDEEYAPEDEDVPAAEDEEYTAEDEDVPEAEDEDRPAADEDEDEEFATDDEDVPEADDEDLPAAEDEGEDDAAVDEELPAADDQDGDEEPEPESEAEPEPEPERRPRRRRATAGSGRSRA